MDRGKFLNAAAIAPATAPLTTDQKRGAFGALTAVLGYMLFRGVTPAEIRREVERTLKFAEDPEAFAREAADRAAGRPPAT